MLSVHTPLDQHVNTVSKWVAKILPLSASFAAMEPFGLLNPAIGFLFFVTHRYTFTNCPGTAQWAGVKPVVGTCKQNCSISFAVNCNA